MNKIINDILKDLKGLFKKYQGADGKVDVKKLLIAYAPYLIAAYLGNKLYYAFRVEACGDMFMQFMNAFGNIGKVFINPLPSLYPADILAGIITGVALKLLLVYKQKNSKKYRKGEEYGSARWGTAKDIEPFIDPIADQNMLMTKTESLMLSGRPANPEHARNKNVIVIGSSGAGKTRFFVKPNIMQMNTSYIVTDPKGTVLCETGTMLTKGIKMMNENGEMVSRKYKIKVFNTINFKKSMHYNPFAYIRCESDVLTFVNTLILNTKGEGDKSGEDFWVKAERLLLTALISYIYYEAPVEDQTFSMLVDMIDASETREDDEEFENAVDLLFNDLRDKDPTHIAVRQYNKYKLAAGKTAKSILISVGARLAPFDIMELRDITAYDEMELDTYGEKLTALFVIISDTDDTYNFLVSIMYTQLFNLLCKKADDVYGGRLPIHVRCLLDEFANIGQIPRFEKLIATIRSREISASIILQSKSQLKSIYKDNAETITGNCDSTLFLGGNEKTTIKDFEEILGKETIDSYNTSSTKGTSESFGTNYQKLGKNLMSQDEIAIMSRKKCIYQLNGVRPFFSDKYDITKHKNYKYLSDFDKKNNFDIAKYVENLGKAELSENTKIGKVYKV